MIQACRAGWLLLLLLGVPSIARSEAPEKKAFRQGSELFEKGDYRGAVEAFEEAYQLKPHFLLQCNIARCHELMGDAVEAAERYRRCLGEGGERTPRADQVREALAEVEKKIGWLKVNTGGAEGTIYVDGKRSGPAPGRVAVTAGTHSVAVRGPGIDSSATVEVAGGEELVVSLEPKSAPVRPATPAPLKRLRPRWFWTAAVVTGVMAAFAIGFGAATLSARSDYENDRSDDNYNKGITLRTATNVFWGLTAAAAGTTAVLFVFTDFKGEQRQPARLTSFGLGLGGTF